ncbi:unnamed protein product [Acanthosepion pharaonis]|uniref:Transmembrane protein n=1 Tax=Acanthosepion pharaonis TaxID=158019 RepID=A0A812BDC6_ACAPH|nr:unnamed protein product [Sepia pharaonis]
MAEEKNIYLFVEWIFVSFSVHISQSFVLFVVVNSLVPSPLLLITSRPPARRFSNMNIASSSHLASSSLGKHGLFCIHSRSHFLSLSFSSISLSLSLSLSPSLSLSLSLSPPLSCFLSIFLFLSLFLRQNFRATDYMRDILSPKSTPWVISSAG